MAAWSMRRRADQVGSNDRSDIGHYVYHSDANRWNSFFTLLDNVIDDTADEFKAIYKFADMAAFEMALHGSENWPH